MSEKRFTIHKESKYKEEWYAYPFCIKEDGEVVFNTIPLSIAEKVRDKLNEQQDTINLLLDLLYQSEATVISEYSSHIGEDMDKLDKIFKEKDIKEIERFVGGCDDE